MKLKNRVLLLGLLLLVTAVACATTSPAGSPTQDPPIPSVTTDTGWWIDTTGTVSPETLRILNEESEALNREGFQLAGVFFSDSLSEGIDIATEFGNKNGIGDGEKDNGLAIAVFLDKAGGDGNKPAISVAVGKGLEGLLNDAKVGRFLDETFVPLRTEGNWEQGLVDYVQKTHRYLQDPNAAEFSASTTQETTDASTLYWILVIIILILLFDWIFLGGAITSGLASVSTSSDSSDSSSGLGGGGGFGGGGTSR